MADGRWPHGGNEPLASSLNDDCEHDYSVNPAVLSIFGRIFTARSAGSPNSSLAGTIHPFTTKIARRSPAHAGQRLAILFATGRTCPKPGITARNWSERSCPFGSGSAGLGLRSRSRLRARLRARARLRITNRDQAIHRFTQTNTGPPEGPCDRRDAIVKSINQLRPTR